MRRRSVFNTGPPDGSSHRSGAGLSSLDESSFAAPLTAVAGSPGSVALAHRSVSDTGIDARSLEFEPDDLAVIDILKRPDVKARLGSGTAEPTASGADTHHRVLASSAIVTISVPPSILVDFARGGSAAEAVWITAQHGVR